MARINIGCFRILTWCAPSMMRQILLKPATIIDIIKKDRYMDSGQIILFQTQGGETKIEVRLSNQTVWLTADQMAELFQRDRSTIQRHIKRIYDEGELTADSTCAFFAQVQTEGKRQVERKIPIYNLDMIISVGYRVNSHRGVQFRQWATQVLKEYMIKGFVLNDDLRKNANGKQASIQG